MPHTGRGDQVSQQPSATPNGVQPTREPTLPRPPDREELGGGRAPFRDLGARVAGVQRLLLLPPLLLIAVASCCWRPLSDRPCSGKRQRQRAELNRRG